MMALAKHYFGSIYTRGKRRPKRFKKIKIFLGIEIAPQTDEKFIQSQIRFYVLPVKSGRFGSPDWGTIRSQIYLNRN
jgi:hypothetical protein